MSLKEYRYSVLVVSSSENFTHTMMTMLSPKIYAPIDVAGSINLARRKVAERTYDFVLINTPLPDEFGRKFATDVCDNKSTVSVMFIKAELYDEVYQRVFPHGVFTVKKPTSVAVLSQVLDWMCSLKHRFGSMEKKTQSLESKMAEIRIVNRAKWVLIEHCNMTEADAHRYIEKQAMDRCITKKEIAESVLQTYT